MNPSRRSPFHISNGTNHVYLRDRDGIYLAKSVGDERASLERMEAIRDALNSHDALLSAAKDVVTMLEEEDGAISVSMRPYYLKLKAAIALAEQP